MVLLDGGSLPVGEEELDAMFTILDPTFIGYLTVQQLQDFHYALYSSTIDNDQVVAAVDQVCGKSSKGRCDKQHFLATLLELNRRMNLEQKLWWDFKVLDKSGTCTISTKDALFLLKATHGEKFSMHMWNAFMKSRDFSNDVVSFHEILMWLCSIPDGPPADDEELKEQAENLDTEKLREEYKEHKKLKLMQEDDQMLLTDYREKEDYRDQFTKGSKRKYNRWDKGGVEALIFDDGTDYEENTIKARDRVRVNDILDSLEYKYEMLRQKLFRECIQSHVGETFWSTMSESEQQEMVMLLDIKEKKFRKEYQMDKLGALAETAQTYPHRLVALIGDLIQIHESRKVDDENHRTQLISDGCTEDEVNERLLKSHQELIEGS
ncbi:uncharacterized protein LOC102805466 [Saccoglossus kowalevskii]|uniref:Uncharacterized protein LOC102805466 n=1 Tax=Saccoglossus kowalevskii TaxID=10224 RepID=A0ABM0M8P9_SACKO|nr:PREDICTED: uncharacterized protein LOC102805466 [Saccoglossus kowalevskii]